MRSTRECFSFVRFFTWCATVRDGSWWRRRRRRQRRPQRRRHWQPKRCPPHQFYQRQLHSTIPADRFSFAITAAGRCYFFSCWAWAESKQIIVINIGLFESTETKNWRSDRALHAVEVWLVQESIQFSKCSFIEPLAFHNKLEMPEHAHASNVVNQRNLVFFRFVRLKWIRKPANRKREEKKIVQILVIFFK